MSPQEIFRTVAPQCIWSWLAKAWTLFDAGRVCWVRQWQSPKKNEALTNCHVVGGQNVIIVVDDGPPAQNFTATIARGHKASDRCFLRVEGKLTPIAAVRRLTALAVGERVYTIGNPSGLTKTLGEGLVSGLRQRDGVRYVQTTAPISLGSSGGALVDSRGTLVGVTTFLVKETQNLNFAIAAEEFWK